MMKGMVFAERYKLEDFIGQGGMSLVYRAVDIRTGHSVAVKILKSEYNSDKEFLERFQREAQAASLMSHHNIVNLLDVGVEGDYRYLVLEYVSGNTLKDVIRQKGRLNANTTIQIAIRILSALQHAHDNGIIHRDIKPQNVLVHSDGHVKVADFGIARMTNAFTISKGDTVVGSVHYSSPEQATGSVVEATSDLYSTGVVMYEMLTGRVPFVGDTPVAVAMQHIQDAPPPIVDFAPETPPSVIAVVMKALEKNPKNRYQNAREMADALMKAKDGKMDPELFLLDAEIQPSQPMKRVRELSPRSAQPTTQQQRRMRGAPSGRHRPLRRRLGRKVTKLVISSLAVAGVLTMLVLGVVGVYNRITNSAVAPDVVGLNITDAMDMAKREGLNWQQTDINHESLPAGTVISQIPEGDTQMEKGDSLLVTVSLGPTNAIMVDLKGKLYEEASLRLKERGFGIVVIKTISAQPSGTVLAQKPEAGQSYVVGQDVELTISAGSTMVPEVTKMSAEQASAVLRENMLMTGEMVYVKVEDKALFGTVVAQAPEAGTLAMPDTPVKLTIAVESEEYQGEISLTPPTSNKEQQLRVALVVNGKEMVKYEGMVAADTQSAMLIPLSCEVGGTLSCNIYLDGKLFAQQEVTLE
ncbi:MAG: Stk1 family PASTA domain-containing Ser/Thr kinase [Clostridia bacterium]